jgi:hypothetical protein
MSFFFLMNYNTFGIMKKILFTLILIMTFQDVIYSQKDSAKADLQAFSCGIIRLTLKDGSVLWGIREREESTHIVLNDFNIGQIEVNKSHIRKSDSVRLDANVIIETTNGSSYFGRITGKTEVGFILNSTLFDTVEIKFNTIAKITHSNLFLSKKGGAWFANPNATRYLFAPSAVPLRKGEGYYQNAYLLANSVNVGITRNISVGGGVVIPLLFYVTPKISFKAANNLYLGAGVLFTQSFLNEFDLSAGIGYGLVTLGNHEHNFTVGSGYGMAKMNKEYRNTPMPIVTINGMTRLSKKLSLITENWLIPRGGYNLEEEKKDSLGNFYNEMRYVNSNFYSFAASLGLRLMPSIKTSVDFSVVCLKVNPNNNVWLLPYLDFVYKFD